jgi:hypothetical protein
MTAPAESTRRVQTAPLRIHIPGTGDVDLATLAVKRAIEEYDEKLTLARHEHTGDWCVMLKKGPWDGKPFPVLGLGRGALPSAEEVTQRMFAADTKRHGDKLLNEIRGNVEAREKAASAKADEGTFNAVEAYDWAFKHYQSGSAVAPARHASQVVVPTDIPKAVDT